MEPIRELHEHEHDDVAIPDIMAILDDGADQFNSFANKKSFKKAKKQPANAKVALSLEPLVYDPVRKYVSE